MFARQGPLLEASSCSEGESEGQIVLLGLWATGQRGCLQRSQGETESWQYACGVCPHVPPPTPVLLSLDASLLMSTNFLLRGSMESADCASLRQVETCALHKARADVLDSVPGQQETIRWSQDPACSVSSVDCVFCKCSRAVLLWAFVQGLGGGAAKTGQRMRLTGPRKSPGGQGGFKEDHSSQNLSLGRVHLSKNWEGLSAHLWTVMGLSH